MYQLLDPQIDFPLSFLDCLCDCVDIVARGTTLTIEVCAWSLQVRVTCPVDTLQPSFLGFVHSLAWDNTPVSNPLTHDHSACCFFILHFV